MDGSPPETFLPHRFACYYSVATFVYLSLPCNACIDVRVLQSVRKRPTYQAQAAADRTKAPAPVRSVTLCVLVVAVTPKPTRLAPPITPDRSSITKAGKTRQGRTRRNKTGQARTRSRQERQAKDNGRSYNSQPKHGDTNASFSSECLFSGKVSLRFRGR